MLCCAVMWRVAPRSGAAGDAFSGSCLFGLLFRAMPHRSIFLLKGNAEIMCCELVTMGGAVNFHRPLKILADHFEVTIDCPSIGRVAVPTLVVDIVDASDVEYASATGNEIRDCEKKRRSHSILAPRANSTSGSTNIPARRLSILPDNSWKNPNGTCQ